MVIGKSKHFLFHYLLKQFPTDEWKSKHLLVAISGGVDSMSLLSILLELKRVLSFKLSVVHVHHGSTDKKQKAFQDKAVETIREFLLKTHSVEKTYWSGLKRSGVTGLKKAVLLNEGVEYVKTKKNGNSGFIGSEAEMRKYRYRMFEEAMKHSKADYLALAHTADDLLETRLIRLIRGTGEQGLTAMSFKKNRLLRPFIQVSRFQILDYAQQRKLKWCEDPSNQSVDYSFRNWIRQEWLLQLERKRPGSKEAIARSLELIAHSKENNQKRVKKICQKLIKNQSLRRDILLAFPDTHDKKQILAYYMKEQGFKNYRSSHILELLKQLKRPQKNFSFSLLGKKWKISPLWLSLDKKSKTM